MRAKRRALPTGTVTFLLTDVEASSSGWDNGRHVMDASLRDLDRETSRAVAANDGVTIKSRGEGDSAFSVFELASSAVVAAYELQCALSGSSLRTRAAIHTGEVLARDGDYFGITPNRTARLRSLAHGGQIVVSRLSAELAEGELPRTVSLHRLGTYRVRDWPRAQELFGVRGPGIADEFPPLRIWGDKSRAVMTVVTVDTVGSQELADRSSHSEMVGFFSALARGLNDTFVRNKGSFLKLMGDGCLALFEDPAAALSFARTVVAWSAPTLVTVHTGVVDLIDDDVVGKCIYEAFALQQQAEPGRIAISPMTAELLAGSNLSPPLPPEPVGSGRERDAAGTQPMR